MRPFHFWRHGIGITLAVPILYVLSAGPVCACGWWCYWRGYGSLGFWLLAARFYDPLGWMIENGPGWLSGILDGYLNWWV